MAKNSDRELLKILDSFKNHELKYYFSWEGQFGELENVIVHIFGSGDFFVTILYRQINGIIAFLLIVHIFILFELLFFGATVDLIILFQISLFCIEIITYKIAMFFKPQHIYKYIVSVISIAENEGSQLIFETTGFYPSMFWNTIPNFVGITDINQLILSHKNWMFNKNKYVFCNINENLIKNFMYQEIIRIILASNSLLSLFFDSKKVEKIIDYELDFKKNVSKEVWATKSFKSIFYKENFEGYPNIETIYTNERIKN